MASAGGDDGEAKQQTCVDCHAISPPIETNYTLIGSHGWRLRRSIVEGRLEGEWRCPTCWLAFKQSRKTPEADPPSSERPARTSARPLPETRREKKLR